MDTRLRDAQLQVLRVFAGVAGGFALAGGTALELYYLHHRFSADLDFFARAYHRSTIVRVVAALRRRVARTIRLESVVPAGRRARVQRYTMPVRGSRRPLKLDFVEEVLFERPAIRRIGEVPVYRAEQIYLQKIAAIAGTAPMLDEAGREFVEGRHEARDVFDLYRLSQQVQPLHRFLLGAPRTWQRGLVHWYRTFSRQELKLAVMDLEIYDPRFQAGAMIRHLEREIQQFASAVIDAP